MQIIFHHPLPLDLNAKSASGIRPLRMLAAFKSLGYNVELVTGYSKERKRCIQKIKKNILNGKKYDFVYSESSTMPTVLTDPHHLPVRPFLDWSFFKFCENNNVPIGLFYRDIYWLFDSYGKGLNPVKTAVAKLAYRFDLLVYKNTLSKLYLPSLEMGKYVPYINSDLFSALPPGHVSPELHKKSELGFLEKKLRLFYVGGMSDHYQMHELFKAVSKFSNIELTVCTRKEEWQAVRNEYPQLTPNINVVHLSGVEMENELRASDIAVLYVKPQEYWEFASPVKLYEYLGFNKPVIASKGTLAGQFVQCNGIGWALDYSAEKLSSFLAKLVNEPDLINPIYDNIKRVAPQHSWKARAEQVVKDLTQ